MIIIDVDAEKYLVKHFEHLRDKPNGSRCIHFKLSQYVNLVDKRDVIKQAVQSSVFTYLQMENPEVFICRDGDIFILAPHIASKELRLIITEVASFAPEMPIDLWVQVYECDIAIHALLVIADHKLERINSISLEAERQKEAAMQQRRKQLILTIADLQAAKERIVKTREQRKSKRIMVIEDDHFSLRLIEKVIKDQGELVSLSEATYALETYIRTAPDILFLDINLPEVSGHELLEKIMQMDPRAYVVILSGNSDRENIIQATKLGAVGFIAKPFTREKLVQYIERFYSITR